MNSDYLLFQVMKQSNFFIVNKHKEIAIPSHIWMSICENQKLSEKFILEFFHRVDFKRIFKYQKLSYPFIRKYYQFGNLSDILINQNVDENFIDEICKHNLKSYINWDTVCMHLKLTQPFIEKHIYKLNFNYVLKYLKLSVTFLEKHVRRITTKLKVWDTLAKYQKLSYEFFMKHSLKPNYVLLVLYQKHLKFKKTVVAETVAAVVVETVDVVSPKAIFLRVVLRFADNRTCYSLP